MELWKAGEREMDPIILIFVAVAVGCIGILLFFIVRTVKRTAPPDEVEDQVTASEPEPPADITPAQNFDAPEPTVRPPKRDWNEVAHLWRDGRDGRLIFQIGDQHYKRGDDLTNREREILLKVVMDFYRWLEPPSALSAKPEIPVEPAQTMPGVPADPAVQPPSASEVQPEFQLEEQSQLQKGRLTPVNFVSRILSADVQQPTPKTLSMVAQIDKILQEMLEAAKMQKWPLRLIESPEQGMIVLLGLEQYTAIDDVPYEPVRRMIRAAVAEWEKRAETGRTSP